jgi:hypothetical protein
VDVRPFRVQIARVEARLGKVIAPADADGLVLDFWLLVTSGW